MEAEVLSLILKLAKDGYSHFICGGALGADMLCEKKVLALRAIRPHVTLELALPARNTLLSGPKVTNRRLNKSQKKRT